MTGYGSPICPKFPNAPPVASMGSMARLRLSCRHEIHRRQKLGPGWIAPLSRQEMTGKLKNLNSEASLFAAKISPLPLSSPSPPLLLLLLLYRLLSFPLL